jgi:hypothetical protein
MATWRSTAFWLVVSAALGAACKGRVPAAGEPPAGAGAESAPALDVLDLPAATQVVLEARVAPLAASPLARRLVDGALAQDAESRARLDTLLARCRIDLARDVDRLTLAMKDTSEVALVAAGRFDAPAIVACIRAEAGELEETRHAGQAVHGTARRENPVFFAAGASRIMAATSRSWLHALLERGAALRDRPEMAAIVGRADRGAALWGAGLMPPGAGDRMVALTRGEVKQAARAVSFQVDLGGREAPLQASLRLEMADASDAQALARFARAQLDILTIAAQRYGLGRLLAKTKIAAEDQGMILSLRLDGDDARLLDEALASRQAENKEQGR